MPPSIMSALLITGLLWLLTIVLTPQADGMNLVLGPEVGHRSPKKNLSMTYRLCPVFSLIAKNQIDRISFKRIMQQYLAVKKRGIF